MGNSNAMRHGYYSLVTTLNKGHLYRRTLLGRYQMEKEKELSDALGGATLSKAMASTERDRSIRLR